MSISLDLAVNNNLQLIAHIYTQRQRSPLARAYMYIDAFKLRQKGIVHRYTHVISKGIYVQTELPA
jgi:hypothetical protein